MVTQVNQHVRRFRSARAQYGISELIQRGARLAVVCALAMAAPPPAAQAGQGLSSGGMLAHQLDLQPRRPVLAHVRFCIDYPDQCVVRPDRRSPQMDPAAQLRQAQQINLAVNRTIIPLADEGFDRWDVDVAAGDCEDYALQKRKDLLDLGWPTHALRIALVRTPQNTYHAVLLAAIGGTDYVLDNLTGKVRPWTATPYVFLFVQDARDPKAWHDVTYPRVARSS